MGVDMIPHGREDDESDGEGKEDSAPPLEKQRPLKRKQVEQDEEDDGHRNQEPRGIRVEACSQEEASHSKPHDLAPLQSPPEEVEADLRHEQESDGAQGNAAIEDMPERDGHGGYSKQSYTASQEFSDHGIAESNTEDTADQRNKTQSEEVMPEDGDGQGGKVGEESLLTAIGIEKDRPSPTQDIKGKISLENLIVLQPRGSSLEQMSSEEGGYQQDDDQDCDLPREGRPRGYRETPDSLQDASSSTPMD